jgi:hypothetical protein
VFASRRSREAYLFFFEGGGCYLYLLRFGKTSYLVNTVPTLCNAPTCRERCRRNKGSEEGVRWKPVLERLHGWLLGLVAGEKALLPSPSRLNTLSLSSSVMVCLVLQSRG